VHIGQALRSLQGCIEERVLVDRNRSHQSGLRCRPNKTGQSPIVVIELRLPIDVGEAGEHRGVISTVPNFGLDRIAYEQARRLEEWFYNEMSDIDIVEKEIPRMKRRWVIESVRLLPCDR